MKFKDQIRKKKNKDSKGVKIIVTEQQFCLSPLNDWTDFLIQFRTLNLGNHEYKTSKLEC